LKKKWFVIQTYSGLEDTIREAIEQKRDALNMTHLLGRAVVPEEVIIDPVNTQTERYPFSPNAKLKVTTGDEVRKGQVLGEEQPIRIRHAGEVKETRNYRKIMVETLDGKYVKTYYVPESSKIETGIKSNVRIRQGMPLAKEGDFTCEMDGTVLSSQKVKRLVVSRKDEEKDDIYYLPLELFESSRIKKGKPFKEGEQLCAAQPFPAAFDGLVEVIEQGTRKTVKLVKIRKRRLFPGYVFIEMNMTDLSWNAVKSVPNVINFVSSGGAPIPMKDNEAKVVMRLAGFETVEKSVAKTAKMEFDFSVGEVVKINTGPFADFMGTINEINLEKRELKVMVNIFGRETPVFVHLNEIEKI
jgi:transcriptional antiterminator NusG